MPRLFSLQSVATRRCDKVRGYKQHHNSFALHSTQDMLQVDTFRCISRVSTSSGETVCDSFRIPRILKPPSGSLLLIVSRNSGSARLKQGEATGGAGDSAAWPDNRGRPFFSLLLLLLPLLHRSTPRDHHRKENKQRRRKGERKRREEEHSPSPNADPPSTPGALSVKGRGDHVERPISYIASNFDQRPYHHDQLDSTLHHADLDSTKRLATYKQTYISTTNDYTFGTRSIRRTTPVLELVADWKRATTFLISLSSFATSRNKGHRLIRPHIP